MVSSDLGAGSGPIGWRPRVHDTILDERPVSIPAVRRWRPWTTTHEPAAAATAGVRYAARFEPETGLIAAVGAVTVATV
jgi:hypothetical protein